MTTLQELATDNGARQVITDMFAGWVDELPDLFRERRVRELRSALRGLLLLVEAVAAAEAKAAG